MSEQQPERGGAQDFRGRLVPEYSPERDGEPDPGEVVWAWVPFEEDPQQGKDRPMVIVGRDEADAHLLVGFMLSSKEHDGDERWHRVGTGAWDGEHRPSWVRVDRALAVRPHSVRREGSALDKATFLGVVEHALALRRGEPARARIPSGAGTRRVTRLIGVVRATGGPLGEVAYALRTLVGRRDALDAVTTSGLRRKPVWDDMTAGLGVPFDLVRVDHSDPRVHALVPGRADAPAVLAEVDGRLEVVLGPREIEPCSGSVVTFEQVLSRALRRRRLSVG